MADLTSDTAFGRLFAQELELIRQSRQQRGDDRAGNPGSDLVGLALSSGGVRSATFCLGILQGLSRIGLLRGIDYLCCVGGGGYVGGWLAAVVAREGFDKAVHVLREAPIRLRSLSTGRLVAAAIVRVSVGTVSSAVGGFMTMKYATGNDAHAPLLWFGGALLLGGLGLLTFSILFPLAKSLVRRVAHAYLKGDHRLSEFGKTGPYPLFVAAISELTPCVLSPLACWSPVSFRQRPWSVSAAEAITASGPPPDRRKSRVPMSVLRVLGLDESPIRGVAPGSLFDSLGVYELIRRRCQFVIACDGTDDATNSFAGFGAVIRKCRQDFGVEIEFSLGPLSLADRGWIQKHYQMGAIHYPGGQTGVLLCLKPGLTGDEPADLQQYARSHPEFPLSDTRSGKFDDAEFESYRMLGLHAIESLAGEVKIAADLTRGSGKQAFDTIRRQLRPDLDTPERASASDAPSQGSISVPTELTEAIASRECVLCAGAGLAAQAGLPTWRKLLRGLVAFAGERSLIDASAAAELDTAITAGDLEEAGDELVHRIPYEQMVQYLKPAVSGIAEPSRAHQLLAQLPFIGVLNTSLDRVLASAFDKQPLLPTDSDQLVSALQTKSMFVVNVNGSSAQPDSVVLNSRQFRAGLSANPQFKQFLGTLFLQYHALFVGSDIDGVRGFLDALGLTRPPARRQYALLAHEGQLDPVKARYLERTHNVRVLEYQPGFNYSGLVEYLEELNRAVTPTATAVQKTAGELTLKSVKLENIGPFTSLTLNLTQGWNLLLGDNGKGKTVILRAIAAGLCGESADPAVLARLLRSGADRGTISLEVDNRSHTIELTRSRDGRVQLASAGLSPIQSDRWLVIGFPALRSIPWENPSGPENTTFSKDPSADDLLPLLRGTPDGRVASLKQWLVNLDYGGQGDVIADFFAALQELTPGVRIERHEINKDTMEIRVQTDGGIVPLSAVSQGTGSVMCWIGTLLQRMREVGVSGEGRALVLIDEIDAHMHPKWQQRFVAAFRARFPNVQVVATTHSPLMVGSLTKDEIWLVRRAPLKSEIYGVAQLKRQQDGTTEVTVTGPEPDDEDTGEESVRQERRYTVPANATLRVRDGEIVEASEALTLQDVLIDAERLDIPPEGWRVDQILTLPYFGLEGTRDAKTTGLINEFTRLSAAPELDRDRLEKVAAELHLRAPAPHESEAARQAFELIKEFAKNQLQHLAPVERDKVLTETKVQLTESITGDRRPV